MSYTNSNRHIFLIKILALFSLVRWYNILLLSLGLFLSSVFMLNGEDKYSVIIDYKLYLNLISISLLTMAGYIINAFYDFEKDMINHPRTTIFSKIISKRTCINTYIVLVLLGILLTLFIDMKVFLFNFGFSFLLWFYSHKLRKKPLTAELSAALLTITPFASVSLYYMETNSTILLFVGYVFSITFTREVIKKMVSLKGDLIVGEKSIPIIFGIRNTKYIILSLMIASLIPIAIILPKILHQNISYYFMLSIIMIGISLFLLKNAQTPTRFNFINNIYKIILVLAIFSIVLY